MPNPSANGLFGTPDYDNLEDESFPPLPPHLSPGEGLFEDPLDTGDGEMGEMSKLPDVPVAKRRTVKRPQPKLDSMRLLSDRGLPALRTLFADVKFKGKGYEAEDLKVLMRKMENWAHRLYPKLQFEDFIDRLEVLGGKKEVQTCLKRIRLDMPLTHEDYGGNTEHAEAEGHRQEDEDPFADGFSEDPFIHSTPAPAPVTLTEEQQQRIERNKRLALEKRLARQKQMESSQSTVVDNLVTSPTAHNLSQDSCTDLNQSLAEMETPLKQKTAVSQSTPLNKSSTSGPRLTNGIIDDSD